MKSSIGRVLPLLLMGAFSGINVKPAVSMLPTIQSGNYYLPKKHTVQSYRSQQRFAKLQKKRNTHKH